MIWIYHPSVFIDGDPEAERETVPLSPSNVCPRDGGGERQQACVTSLPGLGVYAAICKGIRKENLHLSHAKEQNPEHS